MGPEIDTFSPKKSVELLFAKKPRCPSVQPPHKWTSISSTSNSPKRYRTDVQIDCEPEEHESSVAYM